MFRFVEQQFFPHSDRSELLVDLWLPQGSSILATEDETKKVEALLQGNQDVINYVSYVGAGSPRFYLPLDQQLEHDNYSQLVILTKNMEARERVLADLRKIFINDFTGLRGRVIRLDNGPPVGFPVQFRVSGRDIQQTNCGRSRGGDA